MRQFTQQEIQDQFDRLPTEIQDAINASDLPDKISGIGKKYALHTDQLGELVDEIGLVILGLRRSSDFIGDIISRLSINSKDANAIAGDVNTVIFSTIKTHIQNVERQVTDEADMSQAASDISTLERAGNFTVEKVVSEAKTDVTPADRPVILHNVEYPKPTVPTLYKPIDPLIDHLLTNPMSSVAETVKTTEAPLKSIQPTVQKQASPIAKNDTYREPI